MGLPKIWVLLLFLLLHLLSCTPIPKARKIEAPSYAIYQATHDTLNSSLVQNSALWLKPNWWTLFQDKQLEKLIQTALEKNPTLHAAHAKICLAKSLQDAAFAKLLPNTWLGSDVSRQKLSETGIVPFGTTSIPDNPGNAIPEFFTLYETEFNLTFDFDIWGKNRNLLKAALGEVYATIADASFAKLQLSIHVAMAYFALQINYQRREIIEKIVEERKRSLFLQESMQAHHLTNQLVINQAKSHLLEATIQLTNLKNQIELSEHQIQAFVANQFEEEVTPVCIEQKLLPKIPLPCDLPLHLLRHRPDILSKLWIIESAGKKIDVARSGFYPDINLTALYGFQTIHFQDLFKWPASTYFNINPALSLPLFDGGRLMANLRGSEINYNLAIYQYNEQVLTAAKEVLDALSSLRYREKEYQQWKTQGSIENETTHLAQLRFLHNIDSELDYLQHEDQLLLVEDARVLALGNIYQAMLSLIKSLGGGFQPCYVEL